MRVYFPQPILITDSTFAPEKFEGSSTSFLFTSLNLRRTLKSCSCYDWILFFLSRISASRLNMFSPYFNKGGPFLCFGSPSPELPTDELPYRFWGVAVDDDCAVAAMDTGAMGAFVKRSTAVVSGDAGDGSVRG